MEIAIGRFIQSCKKCQKSQKCLEKNDVLTTLPKCTEPSQRLHTDLFGGLTTSEKNKKFIADAFTKYVE